MPKRQPSGSSNKREETSPEWKDFLKCCSKFWLTSVGSIALPLYSTMSGGAVDATSFLSKQAIPTMVAHTTATPTILPVPQPQQTTINNTMSSTQTESKMIAPAAADRLYRAQNEDAAAQLAASKNRIPTYNELPARYQLIQVLGSGTFSEVYKAFDSVTGSYVAVKVIHFEDKSQDALNPSIRAQNRSPELASILQEVQIMRRLRHQNIVQLLDFVQTTEYCFLVMEMVNGGELFDQIIKLTYLSEELSRHVICQVAEGIRFMHVECGIVHRDIKPENLLFEQIDMVPSDSFHRKPYDEESKVDEGKFIPGVGGGGIGRIKIADFGLSKIVWQQATKTPCGTVGYAAPEIVRNNQYSLSVDMWALGCVLYTLLCGFPPFYDESIQALSEKVSQGKYAFLSPWWDDISDEAKDLVSKLLCVDANKRLTITQFFEHPWVNSKKSMPSSTPVPLSQYRMKSWSQLSKDVSVDSPLLASLHGNDHYDVKAQLTPYSKENLHEAFDVAFAIQRIEEEMRQTKRCAKFGLPNYAGVNSTADDIATAPARYGQTAAKVILDKHDARVKQTGLKLKKSAKDEFHLSMDHATILKRRKFSPGFKNHERLPTSIHAFSERIQA